MEYRVWSIGHPDGSEGIRRPEMMLRHEFQVTGDGHGCRPLRSQPFSPRLQEPGTRCRYPKSRPMNSRCLCPSPVTSLFASPYTQYSILSYPTFAPLHFISRTRTRTRTRQPVPVSRSPETRDPKMSLPATCLFASPYTQYSILDIHAFTFARGPAAVAPLHCLFISRPLSLQRHHGRAARR